MSELPPKTDDDDAVWLVSACLLGANCRYNGLILESSNEAALSALQNRTTIPICPEMAGGLPTPRPAAQIDGESGEDVLDGKARVLTDEGADVTAAFIKGAQEAVQAAATHHATQACLKARSPSCGLGQTHTKAGLKNANGVTAAALKRAGLHIITEEELAGPIDHSA